MTNGIDEAGRHYGVEIDADSKGRREYAERRHDVDVCGKPESWAWPWRDFDLDYIRSVGIMLVCNDAGIRPEDWQKWGGVWRQAFRRGYEVAHEQHQRESVR